MTGSLTIVSQPTVPDPVPRSRPSFDLPMGASPRLGDRPPGSRDAADASHLIDPNRLQAVRLKALITNPGVRVSMHQDEASGRVVMQVVSRGTGQVVEQIPAEELLRLYSALREPLLDQRA